MGQLEIATLALLLTPTNIRGQDRLLHQALCPVLARSCEQCHRELSTLAEKQKSLIIVHRGIAPAHLVDMIKIGIGIR